MSQGLKQKFEKAVREDSMASDLDRIKVRSCASDNYDGVSYTFFGRYVPIRPIIDVVAQEEDVAIEQMGHTHDGDYICLDVFVADLDPQPEHPAFVD